MSSNTAGGQQQQIELVKASQCLSELGKSNERTNDDEMNLFLQIILQSMPILPESISSKKIYNSFIKLDTIFKPNRKMFWKMV